MFVHAMGHETGSFGYESLSSSPSNVTVREVLKRETRESPRVFVSWKVESVCTGVDLYIYTDSMCRYVHKSTRYLYVLP